MTRLFRYPVSRSGDALTELEYEIYLERYHNICHEITAIRTKTAISLGMVGVVFTILVALYANRPDDEVLYALIIGLLGCVCLPILVNYFIIYIHIHLMDMTEYPDKQTLKDFNSDDTNGFYHYSKQTYLKEINIRLKDISDNLSRKYSFYKGTSGVVDILFLAFFGMGGIILINIFLGSPIANWIYLLFLLFLFLFAGCATITIILLLGKWCMDNIFNLRAIGLYIFFLVFNVLLLRIYG